MKINLPAVGQCCDEVILYFVVLLLSSGARNTYGVLRTSGKLRKRAQTTLDGRTDDDGGGERTGRNLGRDTRTQRTRRGDCMVSATVA